jgi:recombination protein RecA
MPPPNQPPRAGKTGEPERRRIIHLKLSRMEEDPPPCLPTGLPEFDSALGGGLPRGRMVEIFGPSGSGKTALALHIVSHLQSSGGAAAWIDADCTFDPAFAAAHAVKLDGFPVTQPESTEDAIAMVRRLAESGAVELIVVDSVAALSPSLEVEAGIGSQSPGLYARVLASGLRTLAAVARRCGTVLLLLNQSREDGASSLGGAPLKLHSSVRIGLSIAGERLCFRIVKNKVAGGGAQGEIKLETGPEFAGGL